MKQEEVATKISLWEQAADASKHESVFWYVDHPRGDMIQRSTIPIANAFKPSGNSALDGVRQALDDARRMLAGAMERAEPAWVSAAASRVRPRVKEELRPLIEPTIRRQADLDVRRAKAEVLHWEEYVKHYGKQSPPRPSPPPTPPQPDRRLPRERLPREPEAGDDIPF